MNERSLKVLEFNKIKDIMKGYCATSVGKEYIDELKPYDNVFRVNKHLDETYEAFLLVAKKGAPPFMGLYDVRDTITKSSKGFTLFPIELIRISALLRSTRSMRGFIFNNEGEMEYRNLKNLANGFTPLKSLEDEIDRAIIGENEIADRASQRLFEIRKTIKEKTASLKSKVNSLVRQYSSSLQESIYTVRGDRYVLPVKIEYKSSVPGIVHDQSSTGATLFIEPISLVNLNNEIRELGLKEKAEIEKILSKLSFKVQENVKVIKVNGAILWELDFIFAKARYADRIDATKPRVREDGCFNLLKARHPLINPKEIVENDIYIKEDVDAVIITGPNTGGKTVTLKTVGLLQLMAMSGLMIPVLDGSEVSFYEDIFADIGDEQSIEQSLSTFSSHMTNIVNIIHHANEKSLVLFDELGAGTDPTEGAALAISILENLRKKSSKIFATTHYSELKGYAIKQEGVTNASVEFDVKTLRPTYKLLIGIPGKSNAFEISKRLGLPEYIIEDAKKGISEDTLKFEDLIQELQNNSVSAQKDAIIAEGAKNEAVKLKEKYQEKVEKLDKIRDKETIAAKQEAKRILREAKEEADKILKEIRKLETMGYSNEVRQKIEDQKQKLNKKLNKSEEDISLGIDKGNKLEKVKEGQEVYLPKFNTNAIVLSKQDNKGEVQVQAGIMKIKVNIKDIREVGGKQKEVKRHNKREARLKLQSVATSLDLRGMDSSEATFEVDKYLDEVYLAGINEVTIIHGKGTGVLRKVIQDLLKNHPHVKAYRIGAYGEGGSGVTMVELK
ncbi:endonuclease MutS2 [Clostridium sp. DL1XJH146]